MAEMAKANDATSVLLRSTEVQLVTAAMKIALARHSRPMRTQRRSRGGSRIALSAGSVERGVSRTEFEGRKLPESGGRPHRCNPPHTLPARRRFPARHVSGVRRTEEIPLAAHGSPTKPQFGSFE